MLIDYSHVPATTPPPGVTADFEHPDSIAYQVIAISLPFTCIATFIVLLRLYTRFVVVRSPGLDDLFITIGLLVSWAFCSLRIANIPYGYGIHLWELYIPKLRPFLIIDLLGQDFYFVGTCFVKVSILLFYLRLNPDKTFRITAYCIMAFDFTYSFISIIVSTFGCTPIAGGWDLLVKSTCVNKKAYYYVQAVCNIVTDFATLGLSVRMCLRLNVSKRQRYLLLILLAVGSFACIISIVRLVTMLPSLHSTDFTRYKVGVAGWAEVEINVGIICACLPTLKPLLNRLAPCIFDSFSSQPPTSSKMPKYSGSFPMWRLSHSHKGTRKLDESENYSTCDEERGRVPSYVGWDKEVGRDVEIEASQIEHFESVQRMLNEGGVAKTTECGVEISYAASSTDKASERASMRVSESVSVPGAMEC